jgi:hypothetical protein
VLKISIDTFQNSTDKSKAELNLITSRDFGSTPCLNVVTGALQKLNGEADRSIAGPNLIYKKYLGILTEKLSQF